MHKNIVQTISKLVETRYVRPIFVSNKSWKRIFFSCFHFGYVHEQSFEKFSKDFWHSSRKVNELKVLKLIKGNHDFLWLKRHATTLYMRWQNNIWSGIILTRNIIALRNLLQLINLNKRSAMLLDRLMYNLKEIMRKIPKDQIENGGGNSKNDATSSLDAGSDSRVSHTVPN